MSDKGLAKAKKRIEDKRKELGVEPSPETDEIVVTPAVPAVEPEPEPAAEPVAEPVVEPPEPPETSEPEVTPEPEPAPEPDPAAEPETPEPEADPDPKQVEVDRLQALVDEQRKKLNDEDGARGAALQSIRHENALLFEQLQQARTEREAAAAPGASDDDPLSESKIQAAIARLPKTLQDKYEEQYLRDLVSNDIIVRMAREDSGDPGLRAEVETIQKTQQELASDKWLTDADRLATEAGAEGFLAANRSDEGWGQRLTQPVFPGSAMTTKEFLELPGTQPRAAADMYVQYKGVTAAPAAPPAKPAQPGPTRPTLREQVTSRPSATPGRKDTPQTMTQAEYERRRNDKAYANGDSAKQEAWNEARRFKSEGRVSG